MIDYDLMIRTTDSRQYHWTVADLTYPEFKEAAQDVDLHRVCKTGWIVDTDGNFGFQDYDDALSVAKAYFHD